MPRPLRWESLAPPRRQSHGDESASSIFDQQSIRFEVPTIGCDEPFRDVVRKLARYIAYTIDLPCTFEQLRTTSLGEPLRQLGDHLNESVTNPAIVNALLALRWHYGASGDDKGIGEARANACEIVAWRFLTRLSEREAVDFCLYEIPDPRNAATTTTSAAAAAAAATEAAGQGADDLGESNEVSETSTLLRQSRPRGRHATVTGIEGSSSSSPSRWLWGMQRRGELFRSLSRLTQVLHYSSDGRGWDSDDDSCGDDDGHDAAAKDPTAPFINLNALEIAAVADAKRFLSQQVVQKIITGIWNGDIIFWDRLSTGSVKRPRFYNPHTADPFCRLRVPKYLKAYEVMFFASFLFLYYTVLIQQWPEYVTGAEVLLYLWFAAFFYDEVTEYLDAGSIFYAADVWNLFDMVMMVIGVVFAVMRFIGLYKGNMALVSNAFNVLSLEALFMVPKVCSILSLSPYWGTLIPCLKEMGKDFLKFIVLVIIIYAGFLTTFSLIGRDDYTFKKMTLILTEIFFGSSSTGITIMEKIDPIFGPPLMIVFITLSSILLMSSLAGMLSNSFSRVVSNAREEYLYVYSVYVLEASTSNRLTHFYPPFNLIPLVILRPLRLFLRSGNRFRQARIILLKVTHLPIVGMIGVYEWFKSKMPKKRKSRSLGTLGGPRQSSFKRLSSPPFASPAGARSRPRASPGRPASRDVSRPLPPRRRRTRDEEDDGDELRYVQTDAAEARIAELSDKIDRLTDVVASMRVELARLRA